MALTLRERKRINNGAEKLPHYDVGFLPTTGENDYLKTLLTRNFADNLQMPGYNPSSNVDDIGGILLPKYGNLVYGRPTQTVYPQPIIDQEGVRALMPDTRTSFEKQLPPHNPKPSKVAEASLGQAAPGIISGAIDLTQKTIDASTYGKSQADLNALAKQSQQSVGGESYVVQNTADADAERAELKGLVVGSTLGMGASGAALGASIGSVIPGIGTAAGAIVGGIGGLVGGIFAGRSKKRKMERALRQQAINAAIGNNFNRNVAYSNVLDRLFTEEYGNQSSLNLYLSKGKDSNCAPHYSFGKETTLDSAYGMVKGKPNAMTLQGEFIFDPTTFIGHVVQRGPNDNAPSYVRGKDAVITNKYGLSDMAKEAYANGDIEGVFDVMNIQRYLNKRNGGKRHFSKGTIPVSTLWPHFATIGASLADYISAKKLSTYKPQYYVPISGESVKDMYGINMNAFPMINAVRDKASQGKRMFYNTGGLSGGNRQLIGTAIVNDMQNNIADALYKAQLQNNQYAMQAATAKYTRDAANVANYINTVPKLDVVGMQSNAAKLGILDTARKTMNNVNYALAGDIFKILQHNNMYNLYAQDLAIREKALTNGLT